jgi:spermidine/putrescine transport system substrate-binding protein
VVVPDYLVPAFIKLNLAAPLAKSKIPNLKNLDERFTNLSFDRGNKYTAAYQWGTVGIYARKTPGQPLEETWGLFFDPKKQPGPFLLIDSMRDTIGAALKYKGFSYNSTDPAQLRQARELLLGAKKRSVGFAASVGAKNKVLDKSARAAIVYSGEGARGMAEDPDTYYFLPREGAQIWLDNMVILSQAPNRPLAEKFLNFVLDPEIGAEISNFTLFTSPNKAARGHINPELLKNPAVYPSEETLKKLEFLQDLGHNSRLFDQVWTQVKAR